MKRRIIRSLLEKNTAISLAILLFITLAGLALRLHNLGAPSVWFDEAISAITAHSLIEPGTQTIPTVSLEYNRTMLNTNIIALSFNLFGYTVLAGRIPAVIFGTLSIPTAYLLGKRIKGKRFALLFAFFIAFATVQIAWSQQIRFYPQLQFFFLLALYMNERFLNKTSWKNLLLLAIPIVAMPLTENNFGYLLIAPIVAWFFIEKAGWIREKAKFITKLRPKHSIGLALFLITIALFWLNSVSPLASNFLGLTEMKVNYLPQINHLQQYISYFNAEVGFLLLLAIPGAIIGVLERKRNLLYITAFLLQLYMISYNIPWMQHRYAFTLIPLILIFALLTIEYTLEKTKKIFANKPNWNKHLRILAPLLIVIIFLASAAPAANLTFLPKEQYSLGFTAPQGEFQPAYEYIQNNWQENDLLVSTLTPVSWFYLQRSDYWLSFSHVGFPELPDTDGFMGSKVIKYKEDLQDAMTNSTGWVVIDLMGMSRADTQVLAYIVENFELVEEVSGRDRGVWLYRWTTQQNQTR